MGYATRELCKRVFAQSFTSATEPTSLAKGQLVNFGNQLKSNLITDEILDQHIALADEFINSVLSSMYHTPLREVGDLDFTLVVDVDPYNNDVVLMNSSANVFVPGDVVVLNSGSIEERNVVVDVLNGNILVMEHPFAVSFAASDSRLIRVKFPDPIPGASARLCVASLFDRYFSAMSSTEKNEYGKGLRSQARAMLNNVLNGRTLLHGQTRISSRFANPTLSGRYVLPAAEQDASREIPEM
jgi:hypothetical protein